MGRKSYDRSWAWRIIYLSLGTLAGELENPRSTFTISIAILFPAVLLLNTLPLAVALGAPRRLVSSRTALATHVRAILHMRARSPSAISPPCL